MKYLSMIAAIFLCSCGNNGDKQNTNDSIFSTSNAQDTTTMLKHDTASPAPGHTALMNDTNTNVSATGTNTAIKTDSSKSRKKQSLKN
jgi:hypothetical protein